MARKKLLPYRHWERDEQKEAFWRKTLSDWMTSGLSIRGFCRKNNIPESSFNAWRRELSIRDREKLIDGQAIDMANGVAPPAVVKDSRGRVIPAQFREAQLHRLSEQKVNESPVQFVPLQLIHEAPETAAQIIDSKKQSSAIEISSASGVTLRVTADVDVSFLSKLLRSLEEESC